jgi:mRNA interferase YafQ
MLNNTVETNRYKKDFKRIKKQGKDFSKFLDVLTYLINEVPLPSKNKDHQLKGRLKEFRECHIEPDWLLMYKVENDTLILAGTGSHSELFE